MTEESTRIQNLEKQLKEACELLETIVCVKEPKAGKVLVSHESPSYYEPKVECWVYTNRYFSPLGAELVKLYNKLKEEN